MQAAPVTTITPAGEEVAEGRHARTIAARVRRGARSRRGARRRPARPRTAFVLSGGASLGAAQVGMLQALYEHSIAPDLLVATSVGGLNAAFIASRPQTPATAAELERVWLNLRREDVFPVGLRTIIAGATGHGDHLISSQSLRRLVARYLEIERLEDALIPLHVLAYDLLSGKEALLSEGPALDAVLATSAIPGVFAPVQSGAMLLADGGALNNTPLTHAIELGAERVYVLPTALERGLPEAPRSAFDTAIHALSALVGARLEADLVRLADEAELIVLPAPDSLHVQPTDFNHAGELIALGYAGAASLLASRAVAAVAS